MNNGSQGSTQLDTTIFLLLAVICECSVRTSSGGRDVTPWISWLRKGCGCAAPSLDGAGEADPARAPPAPLSVDVLQTKNTTACYPWQAQLPRKHKIKQKCCMSIIIKNGALKPPALLQWLSWVRKTLRGIGRKGHGRPTSVLSFPFPRSSRGFRGAFKIWKKITENSERKCSCESSCSSKSWFLGWREFLRGSSAPVNPLRTDSQSSQDWQDLLECFSSSPKSKEVRLSASLGSFPLSPVLFWGILKVTHGGQSLPSDVLCVISAGQKEKQVSMPKVFSFYVFFMYL